MTTLSAARSGAHGGIAPAPPAPVVVVAYVGEETSRGRFLVTDWYGAPIGRAVVVSSWGTPRSFVSLRRYAVRAILEGVAGEFRGTTFGRGMSVVLRPRRGRPGPPALRP